MVSIEYEHLQLKTLNSTFTMLCGRSLPWSPDICREVSQYSREVLECINMHAGQTGYHNKAKKLR